MFSTIQREQPATPTPPPAAGPERELRTTCAIVGGGPAGMVLGMLLARAGLEVTVLEKHADFLHDFRGDTVHPTTMGLLDDLGLGEAFAALPQSRLVRTSLPDRSGRDVTVFDLRRVPARHPYIALVPQWELLDLLATAARAEPTFRLLMRHEVTDVLTDGDRVTGVEASGPDGPLRVHADLVVACDGRRSRVREALDLPASARRVGYDVWWFELPTDADVGEALLPRLDGGRAIVAIPREGYLQVAYLVRKGVDAALRARGLASLHADVAGLLPEVAGDVHRIASLEDVKHLDVRVDRLHRWHRPGALCIGDAAHAMSPVGGVGINLAVQDAVAAARILAGPLRRGELRGERERKVLARVQRRRVLSTVMVQAAQQMLERVSIKPALAGSSAPLPTPVVMALRIAPVLASIPATLLVLGATPSRTPRWARRRHPR